MCLHTLNLSANSRGLHNGHAFTVARYSYSGIFHRTLSTCPSQVCPYQQLVALLAIDPLPISNSTSTSMEQKVTHNVTPLEYSAIELKVIYILY